MNPIVMGVTGASGGLYARRLDGDLLQPPQLVHDLTTGGKIRSLDMPENASHIQIAVPNHSPAPSTEPIMRRARLFLGTTRSFLPRACGH